jgi:chloride channel protein, CIC family
VKLPSILRLSILKKALKDDISEDKTYFLLTLATGVLSGCVAVFIHSSTRYMTELFRTNDHFTLETFVLAGLTLFISGIITTRFFPSTSGSGIPGVRIALAVFHGTITFGATLAKLVTSILALSTGMSLGREGPTVAITAGIGSFLGNFFHISKKRVKTLVATGAAGGIAAAFNTPMAAVTFTMEEIVGDLNARMLGSILIAAVIASITAVALHGDAPTFAELNYRLTDYRELFFYLLIGVVASVCGPLWVKSVLKLRALNLKIFKGHKLTIIMISFSFMALLSLYNTDVLGSGHNTIEEALLSLILDWKVLLILFCLKFVATTVCYASGISGGLFMPTLLMGAMLGGFVGSVCAIFFPEITSNTGAYALVGMGAFFVAVIRTPFTSIIMIFEMTRDYNIILPLMIANLVSYYISGRLHKGSIYESISEQDGIHLPSQDDHELLDNLHIEDAMNQDVISFNHNRTVSECIEKMIENKTVSGYPVLKMGYLHSMVSTNELNARQAKGMGELLVGDVGKCKVISIYPDQSLLVALHRLKEYNISRLPVVSRINDRKLLGIITAEDIVNKFGFHIQEEQDEVEEIKVENESGASTQG